MQNPRFLLLACCPLVIAILSGCRGARRAAPLMPPVVTLELQNLTDAERRVVVGYMEKKASQRWQVEAISGRSGSGASVVYRIHLRRWSEHEDLHRDLVGLRGPYDNHVILQNHNARASLAYTSSQAQSHSMALVSIAVVPAAARLHFDTRVPRSPTTSVALSNNGRYELKLPFSFIKAHDHIYFHSVYKGQYRYYRYHLRTERQELLPGIDSPEAMERYLSRR